MLLLIKSRTKNNIYKDIINDNEELFSIIAEPRSGILLHRDKSAVYYATAATKYYLNY